MTLTINRTLLNTILANGLCDGSGNGTTTFCVEQAVAAICGLPITDSPECVAHSVSAFGRRLNDARWPSNAARASGMRDFLIAQIGSRDVVDDVAFAKGIASRTIKYVLPHWLRIPKASEESILSYVRADTLTDPRRSVGAAKNCADAADVDTYASAAFFKAYVASIAEAADAVCSTTLPLSAALAVGVLRELGSPGVVLLDEIRAQEETE